MSNFFGLDSPFYKIGNSIADVFILSFLWTICSLPIITIGASTTALFYTATRIVTNRDGYIFKDFFKSFKKDFLRATSVWILILVLFLIIYTILTNIDVLAATFPLFNGILLNIYIAFLFLISIELCIFTVFVFPILSRFELNFKTLLSTAFFMSNRHLLTSIICLLLLGAIIAAGVFMTPIVFFAGAGLYAFGASWLIIRIFKKYRPEIDSDV